MDDYLSKPVRPEAVQSALERWGPTAKGSGARHAQVPPRKEDNPKHVPAPPALVRDAPPQKEESPVDAERLSELAGGDEAGIRELVDLYMNQTSGQLQELKTAVERGIAKEVERIAHKAAGASATCGMNAIVPTLRELERQGREGVLVDAFLLVVRAGKELERIRSFLDSYCKSLGAGSGGQGSS